MQHLGPLQALAAGVAERAYLEVASGATVTALDAGELRQVAQTVAGELGDLRGYLRRTIASGSDAERARAACVLILLEQLARGVPDYPVPSRTLAHRFARCEDDPSALEVFRCEHCGLHTLDPLTPLPCFKFLEGAT